MLRYAISDRTLFPGDEHTRQARLIQQAETLAREGVDYFQVREKDLESAALFALTCDVRDAVCAIGAPMQIVLNGPQHIARQAGVAWHGSPNAQSDNAHALSCSVHTLNEVEQQRTRVSLLLYAPVFGKTVAGEPVQPGAGLQQLHQAVERAGSTPVLALGGITVQNAFVCIAAGAAGIAGIRLFLRAPHLPSAL